MFKILVQKDRSLSWMAILPWVEHYPGWYILYLRMNKIFPKSHAFPANSSRSVSITFTFLHSTIYPKLWQFLMRRTYWILYLSAVCVRVHVQSGKY